jgi:hypothetical protein
MVMKGFISTTFDSSLSLSSQADIDNVKLLSYYIRIIANEPMHMPQCSKQVMIFLINHSTSKSHS